MIPSSPREKIASACSLDTAGAFSAAVVMMKVFLYSIARHSVYPTTGEAERRFTTETQRHREERQELKTGMHVLKTKRQASRSGQNPTPTPAFLCVSVSLW
jgi:hypothetical protein